MPYHTYTTLSILLTAALYASIHSYQNMRNVPEMIFPPNIKHFIIELYIIESYAVILNLKYSNTFCIFFICLIFLHPVPMTHQFLFLIYSHLLLIPYFRYPCYRYVIFCITHPTCVRSIIIYAP